MGTISIAMTTYCGEKYIEKQLNSLLNQKRKADEVLIFDDRSKDNTAQIVTSFIEANGLSNWHFEVNKENLGFIKNFHQAIERCSGDIIFLCDQDDIWHDDKLEKLEKLFDENPDALSINGSFRFIDGDDNPTNAYEKPGTSNHNLIFAEVPHGELYKIDLKTIVRDNISPGCTMAFTKSLRNYYLERTTDELPHDFELNIYAAQLGGLYFYNEELISYRIHSNNAIGLNNSEEKSAVKFNGSENVRVKTIIGQETSLAFLKKNYMNSDDEISNFIKHYEKIVRIRRKCVIEHNPFSWVCSLKHLKYVEPNMTFRVMAGDLIYALKLQKFFKG